MSRWGLWMLVGAVCLGGCGSTSGAASTAAISDASAGSSAEKAETANGDCTAQRSEEDLRVTIYGAGEAACVKWDEEAAKAAEQFWRPTHEEPHEAPVCSMGKGPLVLEVRSRSLADAANRICARLLAKGWHEVEGPGQRDERERKAQESHEAEQQASELAKRETTEAQERAVEAAHAKAEEAALGRRERQEREREAASERAEEAKEHEAERHEEQRNREETKRSEEEAARGE